MMVDAKSDTLVLIRGKLKAEAQALRAEVAALRGQADHTSSALRDKEHGAQQERGQLRAEMHALQVRRGSLRRAHHRILYKEERIPLLDKRLQLHQ